MPQGSEYYNPIIQAMIARAGLDQQRERDVEAAKQHTENLKLQNAKFAQDTKQQEALLKFHQDEASKTHEHQAAMLENATAGLKAQLGIKHLGEIENLRKLAATGVDISKLNQNPGTGVNQATLPGVPANPGIQPNLPDPNRTPAGMVTVDQENIPVSAFPGPEQEAARIQQQAFAKRSAEVAAEEPKRLADLDRQMQIAKENNARADRIEASRQQTQLMTHRMMFDLAKAKMEKGSDINNDPNVVNGLFHNFTFDYKSLPAKQRAEYLANAPEGYAFGDVRDKDKIAAIPKIQTILELSQQLAEHSRDKDLKGIAMAHNPFFKTGPVKEMEDRLEGLAGNIAATYSKENGRFTEPDIKRALGNLFNPNLSSEDNLKKVEEAHKFLSNDIIKPLLTKYNKNPDQLKNILSSFGVDPAIADRMNQAHQASGTIKIQDPSTGQTLDVPASKKDYYIKKGGKVVE